MRSPARPDRAWTIRQLCREFEVTPRALRFYEDKGLLSPERRGASRIYSGRDRARLQLILRGKRVGFSLAEIAELLALYDRQDGGATQMAASLVRFRRRIEELRRQREDIAKAINELETGCAWMEERLAEVRPDLLPQAQDYDSVLRARLDAAE
ncbi:MAG TPA: MerR family DNA-binding transcriptional regulator [Caulobacteraceae bacterium]|jgi:DNA-binding transcriptional MerR regulator